MNDVSPLLDRTAVCGLRRDEEDETAAMVLSRVAWNGPVLDPDQLTAVEFLGALP